MSERSVSEFAVNVFSRRAMRDRLPKEVYEQLVGVMEGTHKLEPGISGVIASAMKDWAISRGATHYTHWFHPRTDMTAEKHMAFLSTDKDGYPLESFTAKELIQSEPDASSFPSGGTRSTFEARGYTAWDPTSPAFIMGNTLFIPSVFISWDGMALDLKTPLLRALGALETRAMRLARLFGNRGVRWIRMTAGAEQEFFLMNADRARCRPDVLFCGRTLQGAMPPKGQQMDDHYYGSIHYKALAYMDNVGEELARLGIVAKTRHNEVAPGQFEFAPDFSEANLACDQNQIVMITLRKLAHLHGLRALLHEKPYAGLNGSGKHTNFSLMDSEGRNLLAPSSNQRRNVQFLTYLCAMMLGVSRYGGMLRQSAACPGNMFRLGGNEAPPAIISIYLGDLLTTILNQIEQGYDGEELASRSIMDLGLSRLPAIIHENTDRNRTAPLAFTGNKFEFRAPGASQSISGPLTSIAAIWSYGIDRMCDMIEERTASGTDAADAAIDAIRSAVRASRNVQFEGNCYSIEWQEEALRRGLPVAGDTPQGLALLLEPQNRELLISMEVFTEREIESYYDTRLEQFVKTMEIEMGTLESMAWEGFIPAINKQIAEEATALSGMDGIGLDTSTMKDHLWCLGTLKNEILTAITHMSKVREAIMECPGTLTSQARMIVEKGIPAMNRLRAVADSAEQVISHQHWPYPRYRELASLS